jgi:hypothetical protein
MRSSFKRSMLDSAQCQRLGGGARRHPRPSLDVPCAGRQAPAQLSSPVDSIKSTHTNRSPINPVHFILSVRGGRHQRVWDAASLANRLSAGRCDKARAASATSTERASIQIDAKPIESAVVMPVLSQFFVQCRCSHTIAIGGEACRCIRRSPQWMCRHSSS